MKLGSHNSFTYLAPRKWWMYLCIPFARCQSKTIIHQYMAGARYFDLRVRFTAPDVNTLTVAHGLMEYRITQTELTSILRWLNYHAWNKQEDVYVRVLYEMPSRDLTEDAEAKEDVFRMFCRDLVRLFPNIRFCGGQRKYDWHQIHTFADAHPESLDLFSSRTWTVLDDWCPWLYARLMNRRNIRKYLPGKPDDKFILIDFI